MRRHQQKVKYNTKTKKKDHCEEDNNKNRDEIIKNIGRRRTKITNCHKLQHQQQQQQHNHKNNFGANNQRCIRK